MERKPGDHIDNIPASMDIINSQDKDNRRDEKYLEELYKTIPYIDDNEGIEIVVGSSRNSVITNSNLDSIPEAPVEVDQTSNNNNKDSVDSLHLRDQGYAWIVLGAMFISNILTMGYAKSFGILTNAIMDIYPDASGIMAGLLMGLLSGCRNILSPVAGSLSNRIGPRNSIYIGAFLFSTSLIISAFCTTVVQLCITLSVMIGIGHCLIEVCQVVVVTQYFSKKLSLANGIRVASLPFGGMVYPLLMTVLIQNYGLQMTLIILAGVSCHIFICALLIRPIDIHLRISAIEKVNKTIDMNAFQNEKYETLALQNDETEDTEIKRYSRQNDLISDSRQSAISEIQILNEKNIRNCSKSWNQNRKRQLYKDILDQNSYISEEKPKKKIEFKYFKNTHYLPYIVLGAGMPMAAPLALYYTILYSKSSLGLSPYEITILLAFQSLFDFGLRIFIGWLNNKNLYNLSNGFVTCLWIGAVGVALLPLARSLIPLMCIISLYSFAPASYQTFLNVILCDKFGKKHIASTWGFVKMVQGIFVFIHSVLIGALLDWTGSYTIPYLIMAFGIFICGAAIGMGTLLNKNSLQNGRS